jgi:hypothetical protein
MNDGPSLVMSAPNSSTLPPLVDIGITSYLPFRLRMVVTPRFRGTKTRART